ncbi:MAG TPA: N-6 DNA methylase [Flavobacterium sp.]|nr:N-6 DNA methylase [Flavobacterium sp.]
MQKQEAQNIIESTFNASFSEEKFTLFIKNLLNDIDTTRYNEYRGNLIKDAYKDHIRQYKRIGKYTDPNGDALDVLIVEVKDQTKLDKTRTSLRNFVISHLDSFEKDYALVAFYSNSDHGADWRFSFVKLEYKTEVKEGKLKQSKELTPAKRYSFLVGEYEKAHTAKKQLLPLLENVYNNPTLEELEEAFSIEKVTDEFFEQYKALFLGLTEQFDKDQNGLKEQLAAAGIDIPRFTKKLLGQIVFLYFLQKKGWLGVPKTEKWGKGEKKYLQKLYDEAEENGKNFFGDYLQPLFYKALAHKHADEGIKGYYKTLGCKVPFLNGGLFEADYKWKESHITIPNHLFRNQDKVNKTGDVGTGVLDVFDRYNFTIKEDEPLEKEVAVDPEMLGKVFENMLEVTERKSKGAFYTPREIVHYMCQESLIHYLDNAVNSYTKTYQELGDNQTNLFGNTGKKGQQSLIQEKDQIIIPKDDIEVFIRKGFFALENDQRVLREGKETKTYKFQLPESVRLNADLLDEKLTEIKICDPAIGSGAFPVGLLHELVNAQLVLKQYLSEKYLNKKLRKLEVTQQEIKEQPEKYNYRVKRHTIQESIYGVDIDASAIDIARLRLWLSLVVDEEDLDNIEALPNLDYKIVCGNSLIGFPENWRSPAFTKLENLKDEFFLETETEKKKELKKEIDQQLKERLDTSESVFGYKVDFDFKLFFSEVWHEKGGFDVVIGNPPYGAKFEAAEKRILKKLYPEIKGQPESYEYYLYHMIKHILNKNGTISFINPTNFIESKRAENLRIYILENGLISIISNFRYNVWKNNASETLIFVFTKIKNGTTKIIHPNNEHEFLSRIGTQIIDQNLWKKTQGHRFIIRGDNKIMAKISQGKKILGDCCDVSQGIIVYKTREESKRNLHISDFPKPGWKKLLDTKSSLRKYKIIWGKRYLNYGDWLWCPREEKYFTSPKMVFIRLRNKSLKRKLIGAFDDSQFYNRDNFNNIISNDNYFSIKYVLALFNSDVLNYWYKSIFDNVNINPEQVRLLPLAEAKLMEKKNIEIIVDYLQFLNKQGYQIVSSYFDNVIETCIYELYFISEIKSAGKEILKHLGDLKPITDEMSDEEKLAIIQSEFERLYDPNHPVRNNVETLDSVEEVRIIKEALK